MARWEPRGGLFRYDPWWRHGDGCELVQVDGALYVAGQGLPKREDVFGAGPMEQSPARGRAFSAATEFLSIRTPEDARAFAGWYGLLGLQPLLNVQLQEWDEGPALPPERVRDLAERLFLDPGELAEVLEEERGEEVPWTPPTVTFLLPEKVSEWLTFVEFFRRLVRDQKEANRLLEEESFFEYSWGILGDTLLRLPSRVFRRSEYAPRIVVTEKGPTVLFENLLQALALQVGLEVYQPGRLALCEAPGCGRYFRTTGDYWACSPAHSKAAQNHRHYERVVKPRRRATRD